MRDKIIFRVALYFIIHASVIFYHNTCYAQTLDQLIESAIKFNPSLDVANAEIDLANERLKGAKAELNPQVQLLSSLSGAQRLTTLPGFQNESNFTNPIDGRIVANQLIYDGGRSKYSIRQHSVSYTHLTLPTKA